MSDFEELANANLVFALASSGSEPDAFGNVIPIASLIEIRAYLKIVTDRKSPLFLQRNQQSDPDAIAFDGWCVEPMLLPLSIGEQAEAALVWNGNSGKFVLSFINAPYGRSGFGAELEAEIGTRISGWFVPGLTASPLPLPPPPPEPTPETSDEQTAESDAAIVPGQPLYLKQSGHIALASASSIATAYICGLATSAAAATLSVKYAPDSVVELPDWSEVAGSSLLIPGKRYFLSPTPGMLTPIAPTTEGLLVVSVGTALSTTKFSIEIQTPILL